MNEFNNLHFYLALSLGCIQIVLLIVFFFFLYYIGYLLYHISHPRSIPFVPSSGKVIKVIESQNIINKDTCICEVGCGTGHVLRGLYRKIKYKKGVGYDTNGLLIIIANLFRSVQFMDKNVISFERKKVEDTNFSEFNVIYSFMTDLFIEEILCPKIEKECKSGTVILSNMFQLKESKKIKLIETISYSKIMFSTQDICLFIYKVK